MNNKEFQDYLLHKGFRLATARPMVFEKLLGDEYIIQIANEYNYYSRKNALSLSVYLISANLNLDRNSIMKAENILNNRKNEIFGNYIESIGLGQNGIKLYFVPNINKTLIGYTKKELDYPVKWVNVMCNRDKLDELFNILIDTIEEIGNNENEI